MSFFVDINTTMNRTPDHNFVNSLLSFLSPNWCEGVYMNSTTRASESTMLNTPPGYEEVLNTTTAEQSEREQSFFGIEDTDLSETNYFVSAHGENPSPVMLANDTQTVYTVAESDIFAHNDTGERDFLANDRITTLVDTELCNAQNFCISPVSPYHSDLLDSDSAAVCTEHQPEYIVPTIVEKRQSEGPMVEYFIEHSAEQSENIVNKFETVGFECHICHKLLKSISELQCHLLNNHGVTSVINLMCTDKNNLEKSFTNVLQICSMPECTFKTTDFQMFYAHLDKEHKTQLYVCKECSFTCVRENSFYEHCRVVHKKPVLACKFCHYVAVKRGHLTAHVNGVHHFTIKNCYFVPIASFPLFGPRVLQNTKKDFIQLIFLKNKSKRLFDFCVFTKNTMF
jgi:hypothetical protein